MTVQARVRIGLFPPGAEHLDAPLTESTGDEPPPLVATGLAFQTMDGTLAIPLTYTSETRQRGLDLPIPRVAFPHQSSFDALVTVPSGALRPDRTIRLPADVPPSRGHMVVAANRNDWLVARGDRLDAYSRVEFAPTQAQAPTLAPPALSPRPIARLEVRPPLEPSWKLRCEKEEDPCTFLGFGTQPDGSRVFAGSYFNASGRLAGVPFTAKAFQNALLASLSPRGSVHFLKTIGTTWHNSISDLLLLSDGRIVVTGVHGAGFNPGPGAPPERTAPASGLLDLNIGYVAIFSRVGELEFASDIDALAYGSVSRDPKRRCDAALIPMQGDEFGLFSEACPEPVFLHMRGPELESVSKRVLSMDPSRGTRERYFVAAAEERTLYARPGSFLHTVRTPAAEVTVELLAPTPGYEFFAGSGGSSARGLRTADGGASVVSALGEAPRIFLPDRSKRIRRLVLTDLSASSTPARQILLGRTDDELDVQRVAHDEQGRLLVLLRFTSATQLGETAARASRSTETGQEPDQAGSS